jgi:tetratricopeptide (TPR) repeat protein
MSTLPRTPAPAKRKRRLLVLAAVVLLAGAAVGGYLLRRPRPPAVPTVATEGMDDEVVAAVNEARGRVVAKPDSAYEWGRFGMVLFAQRLYQDCPAVFAEAERLDPAEPRWAYFHGLALMYPEPERAVGFLQRAAGLAPDDMAIKLRLAEESLKLDRVDEAERLFDAVLLQMPGDPRALLGQGHILCRRGRWQDALGPLRSAAANPTARRAASAALAEAYTRLGDAKAAEEQRRLAADLPPDISWPDPYLDEARQFRTGLQPRVLDALAMGMQGQLDQALALSAEVLRDHPNSDDAHLTRAKLLCYALQLTEGEREARRALALNPDLIDGHFLLGAILARREDWAGAERSYLRVIELKPSHALAHQHLGTCRLRLGQKERAAEAFREALRYQPELPEAHRELGALLLEDNQVAEALSHLEQAVRLDEGNERGRSLLQEARKKAKP